MNVWVPDLVMLSLSESDVELITFNASHCIFLNILSFLVFHNFYILNLIFTIESDLLIIF